MKEHEQSKRDNAAAIKTNQQHLAVYQSEMASYNQRVINNDAQHQRNLQAHEANYQAQLRAWENQKSNIDRDHERNLADHAQNKKNIDKSHDNNMESYHKQCNSIDKNYQNTIANWEQQKINIDKAHQQAMHNYHQQVAEHESAWQKQLDNYNEAMKKYRDERARDPSQVVTLEQGNTVLAANPFTVTVTPNLHNGVTAVVYNKNRIRNGFGEIYIEDKRGRGEHSRTVCINMLGNIKVVKGNENCP